MRKLPRRVWKRRAAQRAYEAHTPRPRGRPPAFAARIDAALAESHEAERRQTQAEAHRDEAREIVRGLGTLYHPYDLQSGEAQPRERLAQRFSELWSRLDRLVAAADLPARAQRHIDKARRLTAQLLATVVFFFAAVRAKVDALALPQPLETALCERLIPAVYLDRVAERSTRAEERTRLRALRDRLLEPLRQPDHPFQALAPELRAHIERTAEECADLFQRSSSCVEGRNGQLALHHHGRHRFSERKLSALTAIHNYFICRPDGTTAAERFFAAAPEPMFEALLARMPPPPRPARRRPRPQKPAYLKPAAA